jgi:TP901 family phage tail tape measure protein
VRTVTVRLRADINQYTRSLTNASNQTSRLAGTGAKVGTAMLAGFAIAAAAAAKFDKALSNVRAVSGASTSQMKQLRAAALDAGKSTAYTASQAADAEAELARAGVSVADITGGALKGSLALAASGQLDLADAATLSAQAMNTFGLHGKDVGHIADVLSAGANKSAADVQGLGLALRQGGLLAKQTGLSLEDTVGALSAFADHALIGSDAGTSLKTMLQRLTPQSTEAKAMMDKLGFTAYDSQGKFVGLAKMAGNLQKSFSGLTPEARNAAFATIFGSDAVRSASIMYELGADGVRKYTKEVNDHGAAARMAAIQMDNLSGDLQYLRGSIEVALIESGSAANDTLRTMVQWVSKVVNAYNSLPPGLQKAVTLFAGVGGAVTLAVSGFLLLLPRIAATRTALTQMGLTAARTRTILGVMGQVGAVVAGLELISYATQQVRDQFKDAPVSTAKMTNSLVDLANHGKISGEGLKALGGNLDQFGEAVKRVAHPDATARTTDVVNSLTLNLTKGLMEAQIPLDEAHDKLKAVDAALAELAQGGNADMAAQSFDKLAAASEKDGTSKEKLLSLLPQYSDALAGLDTQGKTAAHGQGVLAGAASTTAAALQDQRSEAEKLSDALKGLNGTAIDAAKQEISFQQSLADLNDAIKKNGHSLDVTTDKGRKVKGAFLEAADAAMQHAVAVADEKNSQEAGQKVLEKDIGLLKKDLEAKGFSRDAVEKLAAAYATLPPSKTTDVKANTAPAVKDLEAVQAKLRGTKGKSVTVNALTKAAEDNLTGLGFKVTHMKNGKVSITIPTGPPKAAISAIQGAINGMSGKTLGVGVYTTEHYKKVVEGPSIPGITKNARGGLISRYADGGAVQVIPFGGAVRGPGTGTSDSIPALISNGEYVIKADAVRKYGVNMFDRLNAKRYASGGLLGGFTYAPAGQAVLGGPSDAKSRYDKGVEDLKKAWDDLNAAVKDAKKKADDLAAAEKNLSKVRHGHHTAAQLRAAEERVDKARSAKKASDATVRKERAGVNAADKALGLKNGAKAPTGFDLNAYEVQLNKSVASTEKWRGNLTKIGARGGKELQAMLEGMGEDGYALANALAGASDKQFKKITAQLQKTGELAKATLQDFTKQLGAATTQNQQFAKDLQTLAAEGFGDLASALAAQGDENAQTLAHQAVGSKTQAASANAAVGKAQNTLTGDDLANSLILLSTLRGGPGRGYADLIAAGLDPATIKALVPKMTAQIGALPPPNKEVFVRQWVAQGGKAMAAGGILSRPTMVLGGEAGVREAWIPWNGSARSRALLAKTAAGMGYQLVPAGRYAGGSVSAAAVAREVSRQITVNLYGAKQTTAEQAADIARHLTFVG